jgi:hypothetical protein
MAPTRMPRQRPFLHAAALHLEQDTPAVKIAARGKVAALPATARPAGEKARISAACRRTIVGRTPAQFRTTMRRCRFANHGNPPAGWPYEAGYWAGMRIAEACVARAADKRTAIRDLIELRDPAAILKAGGYAS